MAKKGGLKASLSRHIAASKTRELEKLKSSRQAETQQAAKLAKKAKARAKSAVPQKLWVPFAPSDRLVLLGEGDFSYAFAILSANLCDNVICTSLDTRETVLQKYPHSSEYLEYLESDERAIVLYGVDATTLHKCKPLTKALNGLKANQNQEEADSAHTVFLFNFPHLGASISDQDRNIKQHQHLLNGTFDSISAVDSTARQVYTLFEGEPYNSWGIKGIARAHNFTLARSGSFSWASLPEYNHQLTAKLGQTHKSQKDRAARIYLFEPANEPKK